MSSNDLFGKREETGANKIKGKDVSNIVILLTYAVLFSCDNISSEVISKFERQNVDDIQVKVLSTLKRYLYATNSPLKAMHNLRKSVENLNM